MYKPVPRLPGKLPIITSEICQIGEAVELKNATKTHFSLQVPEVFDEVVDTADATVMRSDLRKMVISAKNALGDERQTCALF